MGIDNRYFSNIIEVIKDHLPPTAENRKVLCLGYPERMNWKHMPAKTAVTTIAKRTTVKDWVWPTQGKYL